MSGYLNFHRTGIQVVDDILEAIEYASTAYHHTWYWGDESEFLDGKSHNDLINEAIEKASKQLKEINAPN